MVVWETTRYAIRDTHLLIIPRSLHLVASISWPACPANYYYSVDPDVPRACLGLSVPLARLSGKAWLGCKCASVQVAQRRRRGTMCARTGFSATSGSHQASARSLLGRLTGGSGLLPIRASLCGLDDRPSSSASSRSCAGRGKKGTLHRPPFFTRGCNRQEGRTASGFAVLVRGRHTTTLHQRGSV